MLVIERDIARSIELYDLSLQAVVDGYASVSPWHTGHILCRQLLRQRGQDLLPVLGSRSSQYIIKNAATDLPVQQGEFCVHCSGRAGTCAIDKLSNVVEQGTGNQISHT
ncbi:diguanylate cyclase [Caballeronia udeis]|uniref:Diguanylate cyclase n=1 Tax=Caballeronia udeis TaxID=1232866 RepID=A0A158GPH4_9BURK|nr:diguanylate cyclase [Caballeronia udeis]